MNNEVRPETQAEYSFDALAKGLAGDALFRGRALKSVGMGVLTN